MVRAAPDGFLAIVVEREQGVQVLAVITPTVLRRRPAEPQHAVVILDPLVQHTQLLDQAIAGQRRLLQLQHDAVNEVLVHGVRDTLGQRDRVGIAWSAVLDTHEQPIGTALDVEVRLSGDRLIRCRSGCGQRVVRLAGLDSYGRGRRCAIHRDISSREHDRLNGSTVAARVRPAA